MKYFLSFLLLCLVFVSTTFSQQYIVKFNVADRNDIVKLPKFLSVDNVKGTEVTAYLWGDENFEQFKAMGYDFVLLPHPAEGKSIVMATTIAQMANWDRYPTYTVYIQMMQKFANDYPSICRLDTIGYSVQGRLLLAVEISDNLGVEEDEPEFFYTSTMHGDETAGFIFLLRLIDYLLTNYGTNAKVTNLVNNVRIFINPNANPDGTYYGGNNTVASAQRYNSNGVDLNRNFPDPRTGNNIARAQETQAMMNYASKYNFVMAANFHGGAEVMNYPWDTWTTAQNAHADAQWFYAVSKRYVDTARTVYSNYMTNTKPSGVTEGGDWYVVEGGRQDYMNYWHHCKEITIELSSTKLLPVESLNTYWNYNKNSLLNYIEECLYGLRGIVTNQYNEPVFAKVEILNYDKYNSWVTTDPSVGNYHRMLKPGTYQVRFSAEGHEPQTHTVVIPAWNSTVRLDVQLQKQPTYTISGYVVDGTTGQKLSGVNIVVENTSNSATTNAEGYYTLNYFQGTYNIIVSKEGYGDNVVSVDIEGNMVKDFVVFPPLSYSFEDGIPSEFTMSGDAAWYRDNSQAYHRNYSMRSGAIGNSKSTTLTLTKTTPAGSITFYKKVSTEANYDFLTFYIDGVEKGKWSGEIAWTKEMYPITAGSHTFKWTYAKDPSTIGGSDACWIDYVQIPNNLPAQYTVNFHVLYGTTDVDDAEIHFYGYGLKQTNSSGIATFTGVYQTNGLMSYTVTSAQYGQKSGQTQISGNTNIEVQLNTTLVSEPVDHMIIYPNPVSEGTLFVSTKEPSTVVIYDLRGVEFRRITTKSNIEQIDISDLTKGTYIVKIVNSQRSFVVKIIVQ